MSSCLFLQKFSCYSSVIFLAVQYLVGACTTIQRIGAAGRLHFFYHGRGRFGWAKFHAITPHKGLPGCSRRPVITTPLGLLLYDPFNGFRLPFLLISPQLDQSVSISSGGDGTIAVRSVLPRLFDPRNSLLPTRPLLSPLCAPAL